MTSSICSRVPPLGDVGGPAQMTRGVKASEGSTMLSSVVAFWESCSASARAVGEKTVKTSPSSDVFVPLHNCSTTVGGDSGGDCADSCGCGQARTSSR